MYQCFLHAVSPTNLFYSWIMQKIIFWEVVFFLEKSVVFSSLYFLINNHQYLSYSEYLPTVLIVSITMFFHAVFLSSKLHAVFLLFRVDTFLLVLSSSFGRNWSPFFCCFEVRSQNNAVTRHGQCICHQFIYSVRNIEVY